jgi:hypothetical protein
MLFHCSFLIEGFLCDAEIVIQNEQFIETENNHINKTEHFFEKVKKYYQTQWFMNQTGAWNNNYKAVFKEVLTRRGYGFTFNMLPKSKLFTDQYENSQ